MREPKIIIDLVKEVKNAVNIEIIYYEPYNKDEEELFLRYVDKRIRQVLKKYFKRFILDCVAWHVKLYGNCINLDITVPTPKIMTTVEKRKWAYDENGTIMEVYKVIISMMPDIYQDYEKDKYKLHNYNNLNKKDY